MQATRKTVIAGNWKMHKTPAETAALLKELTPLVASTTCDVVVCVPFVDLHTAVQTATGTNIAVGAQNCHWAQTGAFTGEISAPMLCAAGAQYVILGHSERRTYFGETDETVNQRLHAALNAGLHAIVCVGESLQQREQGITTELLTLQVKIALKDITAAQLSQVIFAYEPLWAIGTGKTATAQQANEACGVIRATVASLYDPTAADALTVQYGGSMNPGNAAELLAQPHVDGGLIGGASLKAADFAAIVSAGNGGTL